MLAVLMGAMLVLLIAQMPGNSRAAVLDPVVPFSERMAGAVMGVLFGVFAGGITASIGPRRAILIALGISDAIPIFALITLLAPPVFIAVAEGAKSISPDLVTMAKSYKVSRWQRLTGLYLPSVVPYMAASARVTFALGIKIVIIAEVIGLPNGVGLLIKYWSDTLFMAPVVAWGILLTIVGIVFDKFVFGPVERRAAGWVSGDVTSKRKLQKGLQ